MKCYSRAVYLQFLVLFPILVMSGGSYAKSIAKSDSPVLEGPYLGQKPPGLTPKPFAEGLVTTKGWEVGHVFSPDMDEFYFTRKRLDNGNVESVIYKQKDNLWYETATQGRTKLPFFAPDGQTIHLGKRYKERTKLGWSEVKDRGAPYDGICIMRLTASMKNTYVFDEATRDGKGVLRYSKVINGKRQAPKPLDKSINTGKWNAHPFIAPDESYIIWDSERAGGKGDNDLYVSFRQKDDSWGKAINLGDKINTGAAEFGPMLTPDGKYFFFSRTMGEIANSQYANVDTFWVDANVIESLRP